MNRLPDLQAEAALFSSSSVTAGPAKVDVAELPSQQTIQAANILESFYSLVADANSSLERAELLLQGLPKKHTELMSIVDKTKIELTRQEVDEIMQQISNSVQTTSKILEIMRKETDKLKVTQEMESHFVGVIRIEENQRRYILFRLSQLMTEYQREQNSLEKMYRAQTVRQIKIKYTNPDGSVIDDKKANELALAVLENNTANSIFQQSKDVLDQIIETRNDIYRIEMSMQSLNQLFKDLAFLVNEQGEIMDVILKNISSTTRYVAAGRDELKKARKYQKRSRRKLCVVLIIVACIVALLVVAVVLGKLL